MSDGFHNTPESEAETSQGASDEAVDSAAASVTVIEPPRGWVRFDVGELWRYRELFGFLIWRDIKAKYKQTLLGLAWAVLVPLINTIIFVFLFSGLASLPSDGLPPVVYYMAGLVIWRYFAQAVTLSSNSLVTNQPLLTKIYLPRVAIPTATILAGLVEFTIAFVFLLAIMAWYGVAPAMSAVMIPLLVLIAMTTALGVGLLFSALNVKYRDVREMVPFLVQMWMYLTVIIPFSRAAEWLGRWKYLYGLNPMAGVVEGFRWSLTHHRMTVETVVSRQALEPGLLPKALAEGQRLELDTAGEQVRAVLVTGEQVAMAAPWELIGIGACVSVVLLAVGLHYFKRVERQFADIV